VAFQLKDTVLTLARQRNHHAEALGFTGFYEIGLLVADIDHTALRALITQIEAATRGAWERALASQQQRVGAQNLHPWDLSFNDTPVAAKLRLALPKERMFPVISESFMAMGINLDNSALTLDVEIREGKSQHAYCFPVAPPNDVRVLANLSDGLASCTTLLHELGHAVQALSTKQKLYSLKGTPNDAYSEGAAQLFAGLARDPEWLSAYANLTAEEVDECVVAEQHSLLSSMRWMLVWVSLEEEIFARPTCDPTPRFWELCEEYVGIEVPDELRSTPAWARVPHFITHPIYVQNYLLADLIAAQLRATIDAQFGGMVGRPQTGAWIQEACFAPGALNSCDSLLQQLSGETLNAEAYVAALQSSS
jgi:peptidyl-dipeptidase A